MRHGRIRVCMTLGASGVGSVTIPRAADLPFPGGHGRCTVRRTQGPPATFTRGRQCGYNRAPRGDVAQLGERRVRNAKVGSSILLVSTTVPPTCCSGRLSLPAVRSTRLGVRSRRPQPRSTTGGRRLACPHPDRRGIFTFRCSCRPFVAFRFVLPAHTKPRTAPSGGTTMPKARNTSHASSSQQMRTIL